MKRRGFLKLLGLGVPGAVLASKVTAEPVPPLRTLEVAAPDPEVGKRIHDTLETSGSMVTGLATNGSGWYGTIIATPDLEPPLGRIVEGPDKDGYV